MPLYRGTRQSLLGARRIRWLMRDEYDGDLAAGAVNGTPAEPGPGTRVVTDTDGDALSVGGGLLAFANPNDVWGDPGIWYAAVVREAGRLLIGRLVQQPAGDDLTIGFDEAQAARANQATIYFAGGNVLAVYDNAASTPAGTWAPATIYRFAVILRAAGCYVFIEGGAFTEWTLLWVAAADVDDPVYPAVVGLDSEGDLDWLRIPDELWLPQPAAYDSFTRANGALGASEGAGPDGQHALARTWTNQVGTTLVAANVASASVLAGGIAIATVDTGVADVVMSGTATRAGNEVGIILRYADADNYVRAIHDGVNCKLVKRIATAETDVISAAVAIGAGALVVVAEGTQFSLYLNGTQVGATSTINDAAVQTTTAQGLFSTNVGNTQDNLLVMPRGSDGEFADLEKWSED